MIATVLSLSTGPNCENPFKQQAKGSIRAASSLDKLSGTSVNPPVLTIDSGTLTNSAKPPSKVEPISFLALQRL